jgi:hypothetical protein
MEIIKKENIVKRKSFAAMAADDKIFQTAYKAAKLPNTRTMMFQGRQKKTTSHAKLAMVRQYSKWLRGKGLAFANRETGNNHAI